MADAPAPVLAAPDAGESLIGLERIAAGGDKIDHRVEFRARERRIGRGELDFGEQRIAQKRLAAGAAENVLGQHVERADARARRVLRVFGDGVDRRATFENLEAVRRDEHALRRFLHAVIGAPDALQQPRGALRRADIDDEVDVAPVDAEVERGGAHDRAQPAGRHRRFDLAPLRHVERAVMQRDREVIVVDVPEILENSFGLAARIDEDQRGAVRLDEPVELAERVARRMARPRQPFDGFEHGDVRRGAAFGDDEIGARAGRALRHHEAAKVLGLGDGRRQPDAGETGSVTEQPRQTERRADRRAWT